ncbi:MAG: hypothetical protein CSB49_04895 [Proteobacteria bacterium]|nr:MAG: hypothetical protein CSB49_04895 [Pseudomonadota bacterium]
MTDYRPTLYHQPLSLDCARVRRELKSRTIEVQLKDVLLSRKHRAELARLLEGAPMVPCLVLADTVIAGKDAILRYLRLRYRR